jgi:hypothetical protein
VPTIRIGLAQVPALVRLGILQGHPIKRKRLARLHRIFLEAIDAQLGFAVASREGQTQADQRLAPQHPAVTELQHEIHAVKDKAAIESDRGARQEGVREQK